MNWIKEASYQRRSLYSNGLIIQTDDPKRIEQMLQTMKAMYPEPILMKLKDKEKRWIKERWLILDGWDGLYEWSFSESTNTWQLKYIADAKKYGGEIKILLPKASEELEKEGTVLIMQNILASDKYLNNALRSWSTSDKIAKANSTVVLFVEDMNVFPQPVWSKMKIIDVPKSLEIERLKSLRYQQENIGLTKSKMLDKKQERAAVRILGGLNLDQIEATVVETILRDYIVNLDTLARIKSELLGKDPILEIIQRPKFGFEAIGGYDALKQRLRDDIILPLRHPEIAEAYDIQPPRGIILSGPPGTGKTILTKSMGRECNMSVLLFKPGNILSKYVGESERKVRRVFKTADSMSPCILFMDELDRLAKRTSSGGDAGSQVHREIFSMLLEKLGDEDRKWFFVGCTNRLEDIDEAMRRTGRVDSCAPVPFPNEKARKRILEIHAEIRRKLPLADDISFKELARNKYTYMWSGSDIEQFVIRTARHVMKESIKKGKGARDITMDDFDDIYKSFKVDVNTNERLQEECKKQAENLSNDTRLMDIFEESQDVNIITRAQKAKEMMEGGTNN